MKHLYLIRHAKSDWSGGSQSDSDRGLSQRGQKDILLMGNKIKGKKILPDLILSSSAKRARLTAKGIAENIGYDGKIEYMDELYMATPTQIIEIIKEIKDKHDTVFIVGHNPELTELTDSIADDYINNVPTLGIVALDIPIKHWKKFKPEKAKLDFLIYPKMFK